MDEEKTPEEITGEESELDAVAEAEEETVDDELN